MALPANFYVYRPAKSSSWSKTRIYHLGNPESQQPSFNFKETVSWMGKLSIDLFAGSSDNGSSIANTSSVSSWKNDAVITMQTSSSPDGNERKEIREPFKQHVSMKHETWAFVAAIGSGADQHAEKFEWRRSHGDELATLRDGKKTYGWKLVRLHAGETANPDIRSDRRELGETSDGKEVVAIWTDDTQTWFRGDEKGVVGKFKFLGSGVGGSGGDLGDQWRLFAAMSAMHMRQIGLLQGQAASTATTSATVAAT